MRQSLTSRGSLRQAPAILVLFVALSLLVAAVPLPTRAARPNGAGLVIRHGDGQIVYAYVEFTEPTITGDQLLARSHLPLVTEPYGALGTAVCSLDGEGCPATNCFCKSYQSPSVYWHYYQLNAGGTWSNENVGPSSRVIHDGDVDGWSWTGGASGLPKTSIDAIALLNGVQRSAPAPTPTTALMPTTVPVTPAAPTPTAAPRAPTPAAPATTSAAAPSAAPTTSPAQPPPTPTTVPSPTPTPAPAAVALATTPFVAPNRATLSTATAVGTPGGTPVARAVVVNANGAVKPLVLAPSTAGAALPAGAYLAFAVILAALAVLCGWLLLRRRPGDGP